MEKMTELVEQITKRLQLRSARIDKADKLWDAAVLVPLVDTEAGPAVLFEVRAEGLGWQPGTYAFPAAVMNAAMTALPRPPSARLVKNWASLKIKSACAANWTFW